jgi:Major Facilitator Superfamily
MTPSQTRILVATILGSSMAFADGSIVTVAIPRMREALDASLGQMQWVANGYTLILSAFLLLGGAAGDRYGLRRVYAWGVGLFALASFGCALSGDALQLIGARALQGFGPAVAALSFVALGLAVANGGYWSAMIPAMLLMGLGMGITVAPLSTAVMNGAPAGQSGIASAINNAVARVAGLIAVASLGAVAGDALVGGTREAALAGFSRLTWICATAAAMSAAVAYATLRDEA